MPLLDHCITALYEPGNIGASIGTTPVVIRPGTIYTPGDYDPDSIEYGLVYSRFYNSGYLLLLIF